MDRERSTVDLDGGVLRATRAYAKRKRKSESEVIQEALREHLGLAVLERLQERADLTEEDALRLAYDELHAMRAEPRRNAL